MLLTNVLAFVILLSGISTREVGLVPNKVQKQLFLSRRVVTESEEFDGGVLVDENGKIEGVLTRSAVNVLLTERGSSLKIIDGGELALMAGVVDSHVHVNEPERTAWEGFVTGTQAAAAGGITTLIDMPLNSVPPTTTLENLKIKAAYAKEEAYIDVGFWGGVIPGNEIELHDLIRAGVVGFKCFLIDSGVSEFPYITADELKLVFKVLNGTGTVLAFHAELSIGNTTCEEEMCPDPELYSTYLASRPDEMEIAAVSLIASLLPKTDVHVHVVHVSSAAVVPILEQARAERIRTGNKGWRAGVTAETCHHYLTLSSEYIAPGRTEFKCSPPIRNVTNKNRQAGAQAYPRLEADPIHGPPRGANADWQTSHTPFQSFLGLCRFPFDVFLQGKAKCIGNKNFTEKLWDYIREERLDLIASDHSPSTENLKGPNFMESWGGVSSVQFGLSLFWTEASARGHSLRTVSHYLSSGPARLVGLQDKKGAIRAGLDADLVFFDPNASFVVTPEVIFYKNKVSPYMHRVLRGKVIETYVRGQLVYADGKLIGEPKGRLLLNNDIVPCMGPQTENWSVIILKQDSNSPIAPSTPRTKEIEKQSNVSTANVSTKSYPETQENNGNQTLNENQTLNKNQAIDKNQTRNETQSFNENQAHNDTQAFNENQVHNDTKAFDKNKTHNDTQAFNENQAHNDTQAFNENQVHNDTKAFDKNKTHNDTQAFNENQAHNDTQAFNEKQAHNETFNNNETIPYNVQALTNSVFIFRNDLMWTIIISIIYLKTN